MLMELMWYTQAVETNINHHIQPSVTLSLSGYVPRRVELQKESRGRGDENDFFISLVLVAIRGIKHL